ncbi:hypothetical protein V5O48_007895, partial [Marasmius crinis-equi]
LTGASDENSDPAAADQSGTARSQTTDDSFLAGAHDSVRTTDLHLTGNVRWPQSQEQSSRDQPSRQPSRAPSRSSNDAPVSRSASRASSRGSQHNPNALRDLKQMMDEMRVSMLSDVGIIQNKFTLELSKVTAAHEQRFGKLSEFIEQSIAKEADITVSPIARQVSVEPILDTSEFKESIDRMEKAIAKTVKDGSSQPLRSPEGYRRRYTEIMGESPSIEKTGLDSQPFTSTPPVRVPVVAPTTTSAGRNEIVSNPRPKSPHAAMVKEVQDEDEVLYMSTKPTDNAPEPLFHPTEVARELNWKDRVIRQRMRNSELREKGMSNIPDQDVGFDEDTQPVDKATTPQKDKTQGEIQER